MTSQEGPLLPTAAQMRDIMDVCRRVMLMDPVAAEFIDLAMIEPTERVKRVAVVVAKAARRHDSIKERAQQVGVIDLLLALAKGREKGEGLAQATLLPDLPAPRANHRETK
jgi:hypothetical protein